MRTTATRIDAYIAGSADFAKPILKRIRERVHAACPAVEETIKWRFPHFIYKGILCSMAAFKGHCAFGFWHRQMRDALGGNGGASNTGMGQFGRITSIADLPSDAVMNRLIKRAMTLNDDGVVSSPKQTTKPAAAARKTLKVPRYLTQALREDEKASAQFKNLSYSHQKEYVEWIAEAKRDETRQRRIATMMQWLAAGKSRNWKYER